MSSRPSVGRPITCAGTVLAAAERLGQGNAERVQVPDGLDHRQRAAGENAARSAGDAISHLDLEATEQVDAVPEPRPGDRVRHEGHAARGCLPHDPARLFGEVHAVEDDLNDDVVAGERRARKARVTVEEGPHRVEEVGDRARTPVEGLVRLLGRRVGVTARDRDSTREQQSDQLVRALELRGKGHQAHRAGGEQSLEQRNVRIPARVGPVDPEPLLRDERTFEVGTQDSRAAGVDRQCAEGGAELLLRGGDERRQVGGHAGLEQAPHRPAGSPRRRRRSDRPRQSRSPVGRRNRAPQALARCRWRAHTKRSRPRRPPRRRARCVPPTSAASTPSLIGRAPI